MDAVTNFELEAQRRRETVAIDRGYEWAVAFEAAPTELAQDLGADLPVRLSDRFAAAMNRRPSHATR